MCIRDRREARELLAGDVEHRHEDARKDDADGVVGSEQGDGDAVEAVETRWRDGH